MLDDETQDQLQKAQQAGTDYMSMSHELQEEKEAIYRNILTADARATTVRLAEIDAQLNVLQGLRRHHRDRLQDFTNGIRSAVH